MDPNAPAPTPFEEGLDPRRPPLRDGGRFGRWATLATALGVVGLFAVVALGRGVLSPPTALTALVTFLPYLFAGAVVWCFALWSAIPDRRLLPVLLAALIVGAAFLWGPGWPARGEQAIGEPLTVMSWNVRRLWGGPEDGGDPTQCVVDAIREADPDVLTLLEVSREDVTALERHLGLTCVAAPYRRSDDPRRGGLAACTRGDRWRIVRGGGQRFVDHEDWFYVFSELERDGAVFNLLAVHLYPYGFHEERVRRSVRELVRGSPDELAELSRDGAQVGKGQADQAAALLERMGRLRDPTIVAGDFNSTRDGALHASLRRHLVDAWERGGSGLGATVRFFDVVPLRIDYTYATSSFAVVGAQVPQVWCSDHLPVVSELVLREGRAVAR